MGRVTQLFTLFSTSLLLCTPVIGQSLNSDLTVIDQVLYLESDSEEIPPASANWQAFNLSVTSFTPETTGDRVLWFQFDLDRPLSEELFSFYFYRFNQSISVYFNEEYLGGNTFRPGLHTISWNYPLLLDVQSATWNENSNRVHVRLITTPFGGTFTPVIFGPTSELAPIIEDAHFRQITVNQWILWTGILALLTSSILWFLRRQDITYLQFSGMAACWTIVTAHMVLYYNIIDYRYWLPIVHLSADLWGVLLFHMLSRLANIPCPRAAAGLRFWAVCSIAWHLFSPISIWWQGTYLFHIAGHMFIVYLFVLTIIKAFRERNQFALAVGITICAQLLFFGHDVIMLLTLADHEWESATYWSQFSFPFLMMMFFIGILNRFVSALSEAEKLNRELESRVEAGKKIIEQTFQENRELELKEAAAMERVNIYRDLHDDVGSKLLSIAHADKNNLEQTNPSELARAALQSLRNAVSRANSPEQPVQQLLNEIKEEVVLRLEGSGHKVQWSQAVDSPDLIVNSESVFNVTQVIRELVSNLIRHAAASKAVLELRVTEKKLRCSIEDNGTGISEDSSNGNGLTNVRSRIKELGGQVSWSNLPENGVCVSFSIPLSN